MSKPKRMSLRALAGGVIALAVASPSFTQDRPGFGKVVSLDQGWSAEDRLRYYFVSQGSAAMSYDIFLNLEVANSQELFRADKNLTGYGLLPHPADGRYNPDGLPIGMIRTVMADGPWKGEWIGLGCAACHNGQLDYKGTRISISGGNNGVVDLHGLIAGLDDALTATVANPAKFTRRAKRLGRPDGAGREVLRRRLQENAAAVQGYRSVLSVTASVVGYHVPHDRAWHLQQGGGQARAQRCGPHLRARLSPLRSGPARADTGAGRLQGEPRRRHVGVAAVPAQWLGAESLRVVAPGRGALEAVLRGA